MSANAIITSLEASFPTSPPTVLDVAGENLPLAGYFVGASWVVSSSKALLGFPVAQLLLVVWPWWCPKLCSSASPDRSLFFFGSC